MRCTFFKISVTFCSAIYQGGEVRGEGRGIILPRPSLLAPHPSLRYRYCIEDRFYQVFTGKLFGLGLVGEDDAVTEHVISNVFYILWCDVTASLQEGHCPRAQAQVDRRPRRRAVFYERLQGLHAEGRRIAR